MDVNITWKHIRGENDPKWHFTRVLYSYLTPQGDEILYIGKASGATSSVRQRWKADAKTLFWDDLEEQRGIYRTIVTVGTVTVSAGLKFSQKLILDIESLLIICEQPWGNIQSTHSRNYTRPHLLVRCTGCWPGSEYYLDS